MSYPTRLRLFKAWAKAMEQGAQVAKPDYGKTRTGSHPQRRRKPRKRKRRSRRSRRRMKGD